MQKHILMVLDEEFPPDDRVYKEAQSLIKEGFNVSIACYTFSNRPEFEVVDGINVFRKRVPIFIYKSSAAALKFPVYFNWWKRYLKTIFAKHTFDVIHIHDLPLTKVGVYFKQKYNIKLVVDLHENWVAMLEKATHSNTTIGKILSPIKQWRDYEKNILQNVDLVVTTVEEMQQRITNLGIAKNKTVVIVNTINIENFKHIDIQKTKTASDDFILFFSGALNIERGLQYVIKGMQIIRQNIPKAKLIIVGRGSYQKVLEELSSKYKVNDCVKFLGWKQLDEVIRLTSQADISLIPHIKWEQTDCTSPNKLFQSMYVGVPLLVSNCKPLTRIVTETESGMSYTFDDEKEFAEKVKFLYDNPRKAIEMGQNGTKAILEKYNWNAMSKDFIDKYKQLFN